MKFFVFRSVYNMVAITIYFVFFFFFLRKTKSNPEIHQHTNLHVVKTFLRLLYFYVSKTFDIWEDKIKTNCSFLNKKLCVSKTNLHVITGTVFRASRTNSRKEFNFLPDVVMSHKIEKNLKMF